MSIRFQADADLNVDIVKAVRQQEPAIDFASAADSQLLGIKDPELLERAAVANRVLVSHDRRTMLFRSRLAAGKSSPGLLVVSQGAPIGPVADSILVLWSVSDPAELRAQAYHLPSLIRHVFSRWRLGYSRAITITSASDTTGRSAIHDPAYCTRASRPVDSRPASSRCAAGRCFCCPCPLVRPSSPGRPV